MLDILSLLTRYFLDTPILAVLLTLTDSSGVSGIGVDDMFLLMSTWSENLPSDVQEQTVQHVPKILGKALASAGIGITITSLTDFLAFVIGTISVFMSVTNFSLYAGEYFVIFITMSISSS